MFDKQGRAQLIAAVRMKLVLKYQKVDKKAKVHANYQTGRVSVMVGDRRVASYQVVWLNTRGGLLPKFDTWLRINDYVIVEGAQALYYKTRVNSVRCGSYSGFVRTLVG